MASRKNHTLKLAGILLALVLVTSCFVGGTFAKYVTKGTGSDSARVAKFGVKVTANGTMFAKEYDTDTENVKATIAKSVFSTDKVIAPGTKGNKRSNGGDKNYRYPRGCRKCALQSKQNNFEQLDR